MAAKPRFDGEWVRLGELISKAPIERCGSREYPVYSMTMRDGIVEQAGRFKKTIASKDTSSYKVVKKNQLVVGFPIDEGVIYVQNHDAPGIMSPAYNVWDFDCNRVDPAYLELALHGPRSMAYYADKMRGTTARRRTLTTDGLCNLEIPLPSIDEQIRVVHVLDGVRSLIKGANRQIAELDTLVKSRFVEMFGDASSEAVIPLRECCSEIQGGKTPSMKHPEYYGGTVPFIKSGDVKGDAVSSGALWLSDVAIERAGVRIVERGSVLVVARSALLQRKVCSALCAVDVAINQDIKAFTPKEEFSGSYLLWAIRSHERRLLAGVRSVSTSALDFDDLCSLPVKAASKVKQQEFADFIEQVDKSRFVIQQQIEKLQMLYDSLAQEYFS